MQEKRGQGDAPFDYDLIVLGGGPAGLSAGIYGARAGLKTLVLTGPSPGGQIARARRVENYPGYETSVEGATLAEAFMSQAKRLGATVKSASAVSVELEGEVKRIHLRKETLLCRAVVVATGARPRKLNIPGERELTGNGVSYCATCDGDFHKEKDVVLIGGDDAALDDAAYLSRIARKVTIVDHRPAFHAEEARQEAVLSLPHVEAIHGATPLRFVGEGELQAVVFADNETGEERTIEADGAFIVVGNELQSAFLGDAIQMRDGFVVTDEKCRTNLPGVYAAGDLRYGALRQVVTAAADGAIAATEAADTIAKARKARQE